MDYRLESIWWSDASATAETSMARLPHGVVVDLRGCDLHLTRRWVFKSAEPLCLQGKTEELRSLIEAAKQPAKKRKGRPPLEAGKETMSIAIRMTTAQRENLLRLGGPSWGRKSIDKAQEPTR